MVIAVVQNRIGERLILIIAVEQSVLVFFDPYTDLARFARFDGLLVVVQKLYVVQGRRFTHRSRLDAHVLTERGADDGGFRLTETLVYFMSRLFVDLFENFGIERLARGHHKSDAG